MLPTSVRYRLRTLLIVLALIGLYLGAYRTLLLPLPNFYSTPPDYPQYRLGGRASVMLFHPAYEASWRFDHAVNAFKKRLHGEDSQLPSYENKSCSVSQSAICCG